MARICSTFGTFLYISSVVLSVYALLTLAWSYVAEPSLNEDGVQTSVNMRLGPFGMKARVTEDGALTYSADAYQWCAGTMPGPVFESHQETYCTLLRASQLAGIVSCALGLAGTLIAFMLACNSIKNKERPHVTGLLASLMFFQFLSAGGCIAAWTFLNQIAASDVDVQYPRADMYFGESWWAMVVACMLSFFAFIGTAHTSRKERRTLNNAVYKNRAALEDDEDYKQDEEGLAAVQVNP